jgi:hypothetical protein
MLTFADEEELVRRKNRHAVILSIVGADQLPGLVRVVAASRNGASQFTTERTEQAVWGQSELEQHFDVRGVVEVDPVGQTPCHGLRKVGSVCMADDPEHVGLRENGHGSLVSRRRGSTCSTPTHNGRDVEKLRAEAR